MDTAKLKLIFILMAFPSFSAHAALFDISEHSGIIKDSTGNFYKVNAAGTVSALQSGTNLTLTEKVTFPTSKGSFAADLTRTVAVEVPRIGKAVRSFAVASGPVGLTLTAVSLVCELTNICNQAGEWFFNNPYSDSVDYPASTPTVGYYITGGIDGTQAASVSLSCKLAAGKQLAGSTTTLISETLCEEKTSAGAFFRNIPVYWYNSGSVCPPHYTKTGTTCTLSENVNTGPATSADWDSKESLLNDDRFISELLSVNAPVPVGNPSFSAPVTVPIGSNTKTVKDANGNVTGTETTTSEAVLDLPSSGENPSGSPTIIKIIENHTTNNYNTNNELTGSTTTTSGGTEQQQPQSQSVEIEIDNIEATPLQERAVPFPFETDSWGSGSCPADRTVNYHYGTLNLTFEPACQFAEGIKPIVLILAGFIAMFIIMGGTKDAN